MPASKEKEGHGGPAAPAVFQGPLAQNSHDARAVYFGGAGLTSSLHNLPVHRGQFMDWFE